MPDPIRAIAAPARRQILRLVWDEERSAGEIAANFAMSWPAVSQHLRVLKDAGLVEERRQGRHRLYSVRKEAMGSLREVLEETWDASLARLKAAAEAEARADKEEQDDAAG